jgi:dolichyl-phosphate-mannose--protein O-mannosyl transferase
LHSPVRRQFSGSLLQDVGVIERPRLAAFITDCVVCYLVTRLHGVTLQNCVIFMVTTMRVAYHTHYTSFLLCSDVMFAYFDLRLYFLSIFCVCVSKSFTNLFMLCSQWSLNLSSFGHKKFKIGV